MTWVSTDAQLQGGAKGEPDERAVNEEDKKGSSQLDVMKNIVKKGML